MDVLVTGATGFVGRALVAALRGRGDSVRALVREKTSPAARARLTHVGASLVLGDVTDEGSVVRAARGAEVVFHAAAMVRYTASRNDLAAVNLVGTENVLAACRTAGVRRLVNVSTESVTRGTEPRSYVDERYPQPARFLDAYSETKALAEDLVVAAHGGGIETVTLRPAWVWGPDDTTLLPTVIRRVRSGRFAWLDGGRSLCATTYITNLADGLLLAADADVKSAGGNVYYLTDDERVTFREFLGQLIAATGLAVPRRSVPYGLAYTAAWVAERVLPSPRVRVVETVLAGRSYHFNIQRARRDLGYAPRVTIAEGMPRVRAWVMAQGGAETVARAGIPQAPPVA